MSAQSHQLASFTDSKNKSKVNAPHRAKLSLQENSE